MQSIPHNVNKSKSKGNLNIKAFEKLFHIVIKYGNGTKTANKAIKIYEHYFIIHEVTQHQNPVLYILYMPHTSSANTLIFFFPKGIQEWISTKIIYHKACQ